MRRYPNLHRERGLSRLPVVVLCVLVVVVGAVVYELNRGVDKTDPTTFCPQTGAHSQTVVIIDTSDPLSPIQIVALKRFAEALIKPPDENENVTDNSDSRIYVPKGHYLAAYELADESGQPNQLFGQCNPGDPKERDWREKLTEGETYAVLKWYKFAQSLANAFSEVDKVAPTSPIIETIQYVRRSHFPSVAELKTSGKRAGTIFIISDMLQNSPKLTHFGKTFPPVDSISRIYALDLSGIDCEIRYLKSDKYTVFQQGPRHITWWRRFFAQTGCRVKSPPSVW